MEEERTVGNVNVNNKTGRLTTETEYEEKHKEKVSTS